MQESHSQPDDQRNDASSIKTMNIEIVTLTSKDMNSSPGSSNIFLAITIFLREIRSNYARSSYNRGIKILT